MNNAPALIPSLSIRDLPPSEFSAALGRSFRNYGFAIIADHGLDEALIAQAWDLTARFFALPTEVKACYHISDGGGQRGYTPFGREIAKDAPAHDLKEFWHVGREAQNGLPLPDAMPENIWPDADVAGFHACMVAMFSAFETLGQRLLSAIACDLGLEADWFKGPTYQGNSILRLLHYPPINGREGTEEGAVRAGAHEDINLITLLLGAEEAGLQLLDRSGQWVDVRPPNGALVVNIGDMLQRLTNHVLPSTTHRVINPAAARIGMSRYSMPFFLHLRPDFVIEALSSCTSSENPCRYPPITADAYLRERLREIGLIKG
ncbi:MAG: isopenicillin N synthase family oxygenase [Sphingobium sp.]|nr:isopenicillin N synthase family oxygenase [Sphingobium sp.]